MVIAGLVFASVTAVFTAPDGTVEKRALAGAAGEEGSVVYTVPKAEAAKWARIALFVDGAEGRKGEPGYALTERGLVTHFVKDVERWCPENHWMAQHVVALTTPRGAFLGVVDSLQYEYQCWCTATNGVYVTYPEWEIDRIGEPPYEDIVYTVYERPAGMDYNEMAKLYRRHFARRHPDLRPIAARVKDQPSLAKLRDAFALRQICARKWPRDPRAKRKANAFNRNFTAADEPPVKCVKTFAATLEGLRKMKAEGMDDVALCLAGWQTGGYDGRCPATFPVCETAGGEDELRRLIAGAKELGYVIDAHNNYTDAFTCSPLWADGDVACHKADGTLYENPNYWDGGHPYDVCLKSIADRIVYPDLTRAHELGFDGCAYIDVFSAAWPYHCLSPRHYASRKDTERIQIEIAKFCRRLNGGFGSECCFDHMMPYVDYINYAQCYIRKMRQWAAVGRHVGWDEVVPFFELAFHDVVLSNPDKVTQEIPTGADRLLLWEFGGRPIVYYWEDADIPRMKALYDEFQPLKHLQGVEMTDHRRLDGGLVRVTYANGQRLYLNYDSVRARQAEGREIPPLGHVLCGERTELPVAERRPEIRNGTWYMDGKPVFWLGPWIGNRASRHYGPRANPLGIAHRAYNELPSKELWDALGFNSAQVSSAPGRDGRAEHGLPAPKPEGSRGLHAEDWTAEEWEQEVEDYYGRFKGMPMVVDFAFGYTYAYPEDERKGLDQRNDEWHHFIPFCPEDPEGRAYYRDFFLGGAKSVLRHGGNVFLWELFNESVYNCMCAHNLKAFADEMRVKYGTIARANETWGDDFADFDAIAELKTKKPRDVAAHRGMWTDWCAFASRRYARILREGRETVRSVDPRKNVYFCEMAAGNPPEHAGMDYRDIAREMDVLAIEGGWRYGYATDYRTTNGMETVVAAAGSKHFFNCDFFRALAKDAKPVVNNEHYCQRFEAGERVPSRREDFITSLWLEVMHGVSGNFTYEWGSRWFEYKTYEGARQNVLKPSFRCSSLLNPWNVPPDSLDCFRRFREELAPYAERLLPCPRTKPATVAVFYSNVMRAQKRNFPAFEGVKRSGAFHTQDTKTSDWYVSLLHAQLPVKVIFDEDLGALGDEVKAVVFPEADAERPETLRAANRLAEKGVLVVADESAFRFDEYLKPLAEAVSPKIVRAASGDAAAKALADVPRYARLTPCKPDTSPLTGADVQVCDRGDFKLVSLVSLNDRVPRRVRLTLENLDGSPNDRFTLRNVTTGQGLGCHPLAFFARRGVDLVLPPQERVILVMEK